MKFFQTGKLYKCLSRGLLFYPNWLTVLKAAELRRLECAGGGGAGEYIVSDITKRHIIAYWSDVLGCTVRYSEPDEIFMFFEERVSNNQKHLNVLFGDKQGWIIYKDWLEIERVI